MRFKFQKTALICLKSIILFSVFFIWGCATSNENKSNKNLIFKSDSGYINKKDGLKFLLENKLTDTVDSGWKFYGDSDSIGKYYKLKNSDSYLFCTLDLSRKYTFETHLLIKVGSNGEIIDTSRFFHWNYPSCVENQAEVFNRYNNYYGITVCGTGSGYSSSSVYLFKDFVYQEKQNPILLFEYSGMGAQTETTGSDLTIKNDTVKVNYTHQSILETYKREEKTTKFQIIYYQKNGKWVTNDSAKFSNFETMF